MAFGRLYDRPHALPQTDCHRVEVSAWDEDEAFFAEKSFLSWDEFAGKHISLQHMLADALTPCVFDDDPAEPDMLTVLITDIGYEPVSTSEPEEALRLIRLGRCRLVFASIHLDARDHTIFSVAPCAAIRAFT